MELVNKLKKLPTIKTIMIIADKQNFLSMVQLEYVVVTSGGGGWGNLSIYEDTIPKQWRSQAGAHWRTCPSN